MNKPLFWVGLSFQIIQMSILGIWGLTFLDWSWTYTTVETLSDPETMKLALVGLFIILYNISSLLMIKAAIKKEKN